MTRPASGDDGQAWQAGVDKAVLDWLLAENEELRAMLVEQAEAIRRL